MTPVQTFKIGDLLPICPAVYAIRNINNGKVYVGSTNNLRKRSYGNFGKLSRGIHHCILLQADWLENGQNGFVLEVFAFGDENNLPSLRAAEAKIIKSLEACDETKGYNLDPLSERGTAKPTALTRLKMSAAAKARVRTETEKARLMGLSRTGRFVSKETREKMRHNARNISEETREKMRNAAHNRSPETIEKYRQAKLGKKASEETKEKMRTHRLNNPFSEETKRKIGDAHRGKIISESHRLAMAKTFRVTDPTGNSTIITNLKRFCRENKLNDGCMNNVANHRSHQHKGWHCEYAEESHED